MVPLAFGVLIFTSFGYTIKNINLYRQFSGDGGRKPTSGGEVE